MRRLSPTTALLSLVLVLAVAYGGLAARRVFLSLPVSARQSLARAVLAPLAEFRHGEPRAVSTGPDLPEALRGKADAAGLTAALAIALPGATTRVADLENPPIVHSRFPFAWQDPEDPALDELVERLGLSGFRRLADQEGEIAMFRALASHIRARAPHTEPNAAQLHSVSPSALAILDHVDAGNTLTCYYYSLLLVQSLAALGWPARLVGSGVDERNWHATVEVMSHTQSRWVLVDPDFDLLYESHGTLLNAWDLHDIFMEGHRHFRRSAHAQDLADTMQARTLFFREHPELTAGVSVLHGSIRAQRIDDLLAASEGGMLLGAYWTYSIALRNDYLSVDYPRGHPRATAELAFADLGAGWLAEYDGALTNRPGDLYFSVDTVQLAFEPAGEPGAVRVTLGTVTPGFKAFRVSLDGGLPVEQASPELRWPLWPGLHSLRVAAVNKRGVEGQAALVSVEIGEKPGAEARSAPAEAPPL